MPDADAVVTVGHPDHGDVLMLSLKVDDGVVTRARFKAFGCVVAIAAGSVTTELVRGRCLEDLEQFRDSEVVKALGGVPQGKLECSVLAERAVREALAVWRRDQNVKVEASATFRGPAVGAASGPSPRR
jgi:nitrogen fixation NifU-like protein